MGKYTVVSGQKLNVNLAYDYEDNGWSISNGVASHESCNSGFMNLKTFQSESGKSYKLTYTVSNYVSGEVYAVLGDVKGNEIVSNGTYTQEINSISSSGLSFWSDGNLTVSNVIISEDRKSVV